MYVLINYVRSKSHFYLIFFNTLISTHITLCLQLNSSVDHHSQGKSLYLCTVDNFRVFVSDTCRILTIFLQCYIYIEFLTRIMIHAAFSSDTARTALVIFYNKHNIYFNMIYCNSKVSLGL